MEEKQREKSVCKQSVKLDNIKGAIFDMDGTLTDSMFIWDVVGEEYLRSIGKIPAPELPEITRVMNIDEVARYYQKEYSVKLSEQEIIDGINNMATKYYYNDVRLKDGAKELLEHFRLMGVKMCVATATERHLVEATFKRLGIDKYFIDIITCSQVGFEKDHPHIFEEALRVLDINKSEAVVIEDARYAVRTAKAAGFTVIGVFDKHERHPDDVRGMADRYVKSLNEILLHYI